MDHSVLQRVAWLQRHYAARFGPISMTTHYLGVDFPNTPVNQQRGPVIAQAPSEQSALGFAWLATSRSNHDYEPEDLNTPSSFRSNYLLRIRIGRTGRYMGRDRRVATDSTGEWVPMTAITGAGRMPHVLAWPILMEPFDRIHFETFNGTNTSHIGVKITLIGVAVWKFKEQAA